MAPTISSVLDQYLSNGLDKNATMEHLKELAYTPAQFEASAKDFMLDLCENNAQSIEKLFLLILDCADESICGSDLALSMLEEAMDVQTIEACDALFAFLELHRTRITRNMGKGMPLLRLCNELLRRLSKTQDTVFCGRILIFLSLVFPLSERSAVNLKGDFNLDNLTTYENNDPEAMELDGPQTPEQLGGVSPNKIYSTFWSLQAYFNNPVQITSDPGLLTRFRTALDEVLDAFEKIQKAEPNFTSAATEGSIPSETNAMQEVRAYFTPKVLTSRKLLRLELADVSFRRHILVQSLIVLDYLLSLTSEAKEAFIQGGVTTNKSLITPYVLPTTDAMWASETRARCTSLLSHGKSGSSYLQVVETTLRRDAAWLRWKCEGCPAYDLPSIEESRILAAPKKMATLTSAKRPYMHKVGNAVLSKLWLSAGAWTEAELQHRASMPTPEKFLQTISSLEEEIKDTVQEEEIYALEDRKASNSWRALRLARFTHLNCFTEDVAGGNVAKFMQARQVISASDKNDQVDGSVPQNLTPEAEAPLENVSGKRPAPESVSELSAEKRQRMMEPHEAHV